MNTALCYEYYSEIILVDNFGNSFNIFIESYIYK